MLITKDETIDDLQCDGYRIIQKKSGFRFGMDAVLLANFAKIKKNDIVLDIGTGTGIIPLLLCAKTSAKNIVGIEIQDELVEMAKRSVSLNNAKERLEILKIDVKDLDFFKKTSFDVVTANPPYIKFGDGIRNLNSKKDISRHEVLCTLDDFLALASKVLKVGGRFFLVHKPERLADILCSMRKFEIEPKYIRFVQPQVSSKPNIVLVSGTKRGGQELKVLPPLYVYDDKGDYTDELKLIYGKD